MLPGRSWALVGRNRAGCHHEVRSPAPRGPGPSLGPCWAREFSPQPQQGRTSLGLQVLHLHEGPTYPFSVTLRASVAHTHQVSIFRAKKKGRR